MAPEWTRVMAGSTHNTIYMPVFFSSFRSYSRRSPSRAIAEALSDADALIESLEQLVAKKRQIKHGTMQELLTGKRRLPGFSGKWETYRIDELFSILRNASNSRSELSEHGDVAYVHYGDIHTHPTAFFNPTTKQTYVSREKVRTIPRLADGDMLMADASEDTTAIGKAVEIFGLEGREAVAGLHTMFLQAYKKTADIGGLQFPAGASRIGAFGDGRFGLWTMKSGVKATEADTKTGRTSATAAYPLRYGHGDRRAGGEKRPRPGRSKVMMAELPTGRIRLVMIQESRVVVLWRWSAAVQYRAASPSFCCLGCQPGRVGQGLPFQRVQQASKDLESSGWYDRNRQQVYCPSETTCEDMESPIANLGVSKHRWLTDLAANLDRLSAQRSCRSRSIIDTLFVIALV